MNTKPSFSYGIKGKLISAVSMLLVAVIMVVSSTYAWFTLSTAPEVTGISTAIGANGALEIRLNGAEDDDNSTWGNLVNLSYESYGLQDIVLLPSMLNTTGSGIVTQSPLKFPGYDNTGRPDLDSMTGTQLGIYDSSKFNLTENATGVIAVGTASGLTDRQLAFRNARTAASTAKKEAVNAINAAMTAQGGVLARLVVNSAMGGSTTVTLEELKSVQAIVDSLVTALGHVETAYEQMIVAMAASAKVDSYFKNGTAGVPDEIIESFYANVEAAFEGPSPALTIASIATSKEIKINVGGTDYGFTLDESATDDSKYLLKGIQAYKATLEKVTTASGTINNLVTTTEATTADEDGKKYAEFSAVSPVINGLIDRGTTSDVQVNGIQIAGGTALDEQALINKIIADGFKVNLVLGTNSGVYKELADQVGDFSVNITIQKLEAGGFKVDTFPANMSTKADVNPPYLELVKTAVENKNLFGAPESGNASMPLTEFYGYRLDFVFKTNAANSNLLLQTNPVDRIYAGNTNENTQGGGSTMSFKATSTGFTDAQIKGLMEGIRVVFYDSNGTILAQARLDHANAVSSEGNVVANLYLYVPETYTVNYTSPSAGSVQVYKKGNDYYFDAACTAANKLTATEGATPTYSGNYTPDGEGAAAVSFTGGTISVSGGLVTNKDANATKNLDAIITALDQNVEKNVSVLVYLDGDVIGNEDVAYDVAKSVSGMLNLQFASSADLQPMEYGGLHIPAETAATEYTVTYDVNGGNEGTGPAADSVNSGENITLSTTAPTRDGYTFVGWSEDPIGTVAITELTNVTENKTVYAIWTQDTQNP